MIEPAEIERILRDAFPDATVLTIDDQATLSSLIATVMKKNLHHFAVTEDGTASTPVSASMESQPSGPGVTAAQVIADELTT